MTKSKTWHVIIIVIGVVVVVGAVYFFENQSSSIQTVTQTGSPTTTSSLNTYGMSQYTDYNYGFSFWYPTALSVTSSSTNDNVSFPGGVAVETLQIGSMGGTSITVVESPMSTITDEPANHASPIAQTKYFYDPGYDQWMVAYPQGALGPGPSATTTANVSKTTISGLIMLPSGKRFDTTIIPLTTTTFLVISDGGGSSFTSELADTVTQIGVSVPQPVEETSLQAEANGYNLMK